MLCFCVRETSDLVHARGSEVDVNVLSVALKLPVLLVCELQVALVFSICFPPRVFGGVGSVQSVLIKLRLQLALLELRTVRTAILQNIHMSASEYRKHVYAMFILDLYHIYPRFMWDL